MLSYIDLESYFKINFTLKDIKNFSITELENMYPWERDIYVELVKNSINEENERNKQHVN